MEEKKPVVIYHCDKKNVVEVFTSTVAFGISIYVIHDINSQEELLLIANDLDGIIFEEGVEVLPSNKYISLSNVDFSHQNRRIYVKQLSTGSIFNSLNHRTLKVLHLFFIPPPIDYYLQIKKSSNYDEIFVIKESLYKEIDKDDELFLFIEGFFQEDTLEKKVEMFFTVKDNEPYIESIFPTILQQRDIDLNHYKSQIIQKNIQEKILFNGVDSQEEYIKSLNDDLSCRKFTRGVFNSGCSLFFDFKCQSNIQEILDISYQRTIDKLRILIPGCGTGEEAFFVAGCLEYMKKNSAIDIDYQIFASDINDEALSQTLMPRYTSCEIEHIDLDLQEILFEAKDGNFFLRKEIKEKIIFSEIDFFQDSLLLNIDVIIARNFLSILSPEYFSKAVSIFNLSLIDEGFLVLSSGEKVEINQEMFYQNQDLEEKNFFVNKICDNYDKMSLIEKYEQPKLIEAMLYQTMKNLQDQFVVVSKNDLRIILRKGNLEEYIETGKEKEDNLLVLAKDSIRYELEEAIKFVKEHNTSKLEKVPYYTKEGKANMVYLDVIPLPDNNIARDLFLVLFFHPSGKSDNYHTNKRPGVKFR